MLRTVIASLLLGATLLSGCGYAALSAAAMKAQCENEGKYWDYTKGCIDQAPADNGDGGSGGDSTNGGDSGSGTGNAARGGR